MGLDNIPHIYPCVKAGTVVYEYPVYETYNEAGEVEGSEEVKRIDCTKTQEMGCCPWKTQKEADNPGVPVYGMMGTSCWFRGKAGNWTLEAMATATGESPPDDLDFFGQGIIRGVGLDVDGDQEGIDPEDCLVLADWMDERMDDYQRVLMTEDHTAAEVAQEMSYARYAAWWLRFVAEYGEGSDIWY